MYHTSNVFIWMFENRFTNKGHIAKYFAKIVKIENEEHCTENECLNIGLYNFGGHVRPTYVLNLLNK